MRPATVFACLAAFTFGARAESVQPPDSAPACRDFRYFADVPARPDDPHAALDVVCAPETRSWVAVENERTLREAEADPQFPSIYSIARTIARARRQSDGESGVELDSADMFTAGDWSYTISRDRTVLARRPLRAAIQGGGDVENIVDLSRSAQGTQILGALVHDDRALLLLRRNGRPSLREYDLRRGLPVDAGFSIDGFDGSAAWVNADTIWISDPRSHGVLRLRRGQAVGQADLVAQKPEGGRALTVSMIGDRAVAMGGSLEAPNVVAIAFVAVPTGEARRFAVPAHAMFRGIAGDQWIFEIAEGSPNLLPGSYISVSEEERNLVQPAASLILDAGREAMASSPATAGHGLLMITSDHAQARVFYLVHDRVGGWRRRAFEMPQYANMANMWVQFAQRGLPVASVGLQSFLQPEVTLVVDLDAMRVREVRRHPSLFNEGEFVTEQLFARSRDGTRIPYFVVRRRHMRHDGANPTLLWGYGSSVPQMPRYDPALGRLWLDAGGVYVSAIVRGGGELPNWRTAGTSREKTYEDFIAVAEDLIRRRITAPQRLGIRGHSNGGLLVGVMLNRRPDLFSAAIMENPELDIVTLVSGSSGRSIGLFGDWSDPDTRNFIRRTDPYWNLAPASGFPPVLVTTNTFDDWVRSGSARKYAAKLRGHEMEYWYYEHPGGTHNPLGDTVESEALHNALLYTYLRRQLMPAGHP